MREITNMMIKNFKILKLGYDFCGYTFRHKEELSFHHTMIARRDCTKLNVPSEGYLEWNGAILKQLTSHNYLHYIENKDYDRFLAITSELIDENIKGYLDKENLHYIDDALKYFEHEYCSATTKKGKPLIKEQYLHRNHFMV